MQESLSLNRDWFGETGLFSSKKTFQKKHFIHFISISLSKLFSQVGSNETEQ